MSEIKFDQKLLDSAPNTSKKAHEKLIHITKKLDISLRERIINRVVSIVVALLVCALVLNFFVPGKFGTFFSESFNALTGSVNKTFNTLYEFAILLGISIAILPAFKMKFWNLGGEGQVLAGTLVAALISKYIGPHLPTALATIFMILGGALGGIIWAVIPSIFKALFDTNETLFTLMMNYIAMGLIIFFAFVVNPDHGTFSGLTNGVFDFKENYMSSLVPLIIVLLMTGFMFTYLNFTKHGYELTVVGETRNTAKYVGINVKKVIIRTLILSGALCGIIGYFMVAKQKSVSEVLVDGRGFTAVMIAWLGHMNVIEIVIIAFLVAFITRGSSQVAMRLDLGSSFTKISIAIFLITILAFEFFLNYEIHINKNFFKSKKAEKEAK